MKISMDKKYRTRGRDPVTIISTEGRGGQPVVGYVGDSSTITEWYAGGQHGDFPSYDLIEVKTPEQVIAETFGSHDVEDPQYQSRLIAKALREEGLLK